MIYIIVVYIEENHENDFHENVDYTTLLKICEFVLFSKYSILLIFIFNSISKSTIAAAIKFINSLRITF